MWGIWVVDEWFVNSNGTILLFEFEDANKVKDQLDYDPDRPMTVKKCDEVGEVYAGKLLDNEL